MSKKTNYIVAIDPGTTESALVLLEVGTNRVCEHIKAENSLILGMLKRKATHDKTLAVEMIASYGMPVGREVFETCVWIGRFIEAWNCHHELVYRKDVKMHLCGSTRAKDGNIRQALIDRFGGSKQAAIGLKASPGPLYGFSGDRWAALGVAVTYAAQIK